MRPLKIRAGAPPRTRHPGFDRLETRDVPSVAATSLALQTPRLRTLELAMNGPSQSVNPGGPNIAVASCPKHVQTLFFDPLDRELALRPRDNDDSHQDRQQRLPSGDIRGASTDRRRGESRDVYGQVRRAVYRGTAPILRPIGHNPHLQQRERCDVQPVPQGASPASDPAAGRSDGVTHRQRSGRRACRRTGDSLSKQHPADGEQHLPRPDQRLGRFQQ